MIAVRGVTKSFKAGTQTITALRGITLDIARGSMCAIAGVSGSGKSTLLNILGGIDTPTSGNVVIAGTDISSLSRRALTAFRAKTVGFIFQHFNLIPALNVYDNIAVPLKLKGQRADRVRILELINRVGLTQFTDRRPDELSGGQKQRVAIARSLAHDPPLVLADEITANLDTATSAQIIQLLEQINRESGVTIIFASHDHRLLSTLKRIIILRDGVIDTAPDARP